MAPDPTRLTQTELIRLINGTPFGAVLSRSRLRRQIDAAGARILCPGDSARIHLVRYVRWLALEQQRLFQEAETAQGAGGYAEARGRQGARQRAKTKAGQDITGKEPLPDVVNWARREKCAASLRRFCETYFAATFFRRWSKDHLEAIKVIERAIKGDGLFAFAMPRGSGKTSLCRVAALWAVLCGYRAFVVAIGASDSRAKGLLRPIRMALLENDLLLADWPEAVYAFRALENSSKRQAQQHCDGRLTHIHWGPSRLVFPRIPAELLPAALRKRGYTEAPAAGAIISITSLDANIRGQQHTRPDGSTIRPSLIILDDPQTRISARSPMQTKQRLELLAGDVLGMAGPGESLSAVVTCTKIYLGDLADHLLDREKMPEWQGRCTKLLDSLPTNTELWEQYAERRADGLRAGKGIASATRFYRAHRKAMDRGAKAAWSARFKAKTELSAIQYAMNIKLRDEEVFFAEYQNEPMVEQISEQLLSLQQVMERTNGRPPRSVPIDAPHVTAYVDVHDQLLYYVVCAWADSFTGYVIDYGTFPQQSRRWFGLSTARQTLPRKFPGRGKDAVILAGLVALLEDLVKRDYTRAGGGVARCELIMVDSGYKPDLVGAAKHKVGGQITLSIGAGIGARNRPISQYKRKTGERYGHHWYQPNVIGTREWPHIRIDTNYWKSWIHEALAMPVGDPGNLTLFGSKAADHELFAEHVAGSETWVKTYGQGRTVHEWKVRPSRPDNHWFDCLVGCAVAGCIAGAKTAAMAVSAGRARKRYTQADLGRGGK